MSYRRNNNRFLRAFTILFVLAVTGILASVVINALAALMNLWFLVVAVLVVSFVILYTNLEK